LIGIEARVFDELADLETERLLSHPIADAARQMGFRRFGQKFVQLGNSVVPKSAPKPVADAGRSGTLRAPPTAAPTEPTEATLGFSSKRKAIDNSPGPAI